MSKHTPGPWEYIPDDGDHCGVIKAATGWVCDLVDPPSQQDAVLMAASPDMLEALELGRAAIGEHIAPSDCYSTGPLTGNHIEDLIVCPACRFISAYEKAIAKAKGER